MERLHVDKIVSSPLCSLGGKIQKDVCEGENLPMWYQRGRINQACSVLLLLLSECSFKYNFPKKFFRLF